MKYGMPRKIDDEMREKALWTLAGAVALATLAWFGYRAYMKPYELRRAELKALVLEADGILERFDLNLAAGKTEELSRAQATLEDIVSRAEKEDSTVPELALDVELYVAAERERAQRLLHEHAEVTAACARGRKALQEAAERAGTAAEAIRQLLGNGGADAVLAARDELKAYRDELDALALTARPGSRESRIAKSHFAEAQTKVEDISIVQISGRTDATRQALDDANALAGKAEDAERQIRDAMARGSAIRKEAATLKIDQHSGRFAELRTRLGTAAKEAKEAQDAYAAAEKAAREERSRIQDKAERDCRETVEAINRLVKEHGSFLPTAPIASASAAEKELKEQIAKNNAAWKKQSEQTAALMLQTDNLRKEAASFDGQFDDILKTGAVAIDVGRVDDLLEELARTRGELAAATAALNIGGLRRELEKNVGRAQAALGSMREKVPDVQRIAGEIRRAAKAAGQELAQAKDERDTLAKRLGAGRGNAKDAMERALADCIFPADAARDLAGLESERASNGKDCLALQARLDKAKAAMKDFADKLGNIRQTLENARANGQFAPESWEAGTIGWTPGNPKSTRISKGSVLVPYGTLAARQYEWEFALPFDKPGRRTIEVQVAKPSAEPVAQSIDRNLAVKQEGQRVKGGWIDVACKLMAGTHAWHDDLWIFNYLKLSSHTTVLAAEGWFDSGYQTFKLRLDLDSNPKVSGDSKWHADLLEFRVCVDGIPVRQFWHQAR